MKQLFFLIGLIWPLAALGSLLLGPFVGIDRSKLKRELVDFWNVKNLPTLAKFARRIALVVSWGGFLFPVVFPLYGLIVGALFFTLFAIV